jgi:hypothetical protein
MTATRTGSGTATGAATGARTTAGSATGGCKHLPPSAVGVGIHVVNEVP